MSKASRKYWARKNKYKKKKGKKKKKKSKNFKTSNLENKFLYHILQPVCEKHGLKYETQHQIESKHYDFYIPNIRLLIEVDGTYWHGKKKDKNGKLNKIQKRNILNDQYKNKLAIKNKYRIVRFWGDEIKEKTSTVRKKLNDKIKSYK